MTKYLNNRTIRLNDDGTIDNLDIAVIGIKSFILTETAVPDMDVNFSKGTVKTVDREYYHTIAGSETLTAANAGKTKISILQKTTNSDAVPTIKDGSEDELVYPDADANNIIIGYVGDVTTPITETTDAVVEATPTGTQVQLIPVNTNRK